MAIEHTFIGKDGIETKTLTPIKAIRAHCLECLSWSYEEVKNCSATKCPLFPFRLGKSHSGRKGNPNCFKKEL